MIVFISPVPSDESVKIAIASYLSLHEIPDDKGKITLEQESIPELYCYLSRLGLVEDEPSSLLRYIGFQVWLP